MLFNSTEFLVFFPVVVVLAFLVPHRFRWALLLAASYYFYAAWKPHYLVLLLAISATSYVFALRMADSGSPAGRKRNLIALLCINLGILFGFKYLNFFNDQARHVFVLLGLSYPLPDLRIALPIGISFFAFQAVGYGIDVYRGDKEPERHPGIFALFVGFFPQLIAGPIGRSRELLPQLHGRTKLDIDRVADGLRLMLWGYFKKAVVADKLALYVDAVYNNPGQYTGLPLILATYFFTIQIYCDFSGYTDIARGAARVLGYDLMVNFRAPYFSRSVGEFWRRWHISLSSWFRDYLYIPLGGNRVSIPRWSLNIMTVFLLSGLWHGANWTFIAWGALHGAYLWVGTRTHGWRGRILSALGIRGEGAALGVARAVITFHLVAFAWIFFRANSLGDAAYVIGHMFSGLRLDLGFGTRFGLDDLVASLAAIAVLIGVDSLESTLGMKRLLGRMPLWVRWPIYTAVLLGIALLGEFGERSFIYSQF